jgi:hypothetical protein
MMETQQSLVEKLKQESKGYNRLRPEFVEREKREQTGHLIKLVKLLGRPLNENEMRELGTIL